MSADELIGRGALESGKEALSPGERLLWRLNRLRCMTPAEVAHRVVRLASMHAERVGILGGDGVPAPNLEGAAAATLSELPDVDPAPYLAAAKRIAAGRLEVFALEDAFVGAPPRWNRDPKTGTEAPLRFGKLLDYRDPACVGNIKYLWEPNRHLHLVTLAQAYALSSEAEPLDAFADHLESWFDACPYRLGANWSSALEAGVRLINWSLAWRFLGGAGSRAFASRRGARLRMRWLRSIFQHVQFVRGFFSRHSSANNHLIGEAAGVWIGTLTWPYWPQFARWSDEAKGILETEALAQNAPDGVNREQSTSYQQFELDLLLLALVAGSAAGRSFSAEVHARIEAMLEYLASIMDAGGHVPMFGDSDDGAVARLAQGEGFCRFRSVLATGAIVFGRGDFKAKAGRLDDKTRWLIGASADRRYEAQNASPRGLPVRTAFPEGGYYILGSDFESAQEIRMVVDAGPLGYQSIAAHGHADALSFTLSAGGMEFLIDPGTYAYHTQGPWRQYFRGTGAHNTLRVDGEDQSQPGGNFLWLRKARAGCTVWSASADQDHFSGWQDGYLRLADPVMHRRRISLDKASGVFSIEDRLEMAGTHDIELFFHCSERCRVSACEDGYEIRQGRRALRLRLPRAEGAVSRVHLGSFAPICGWISRRFDEKQPAPTIAWRSRISGDAILRTEIDCRAVL